MDGLWKHYTKWKKPVSKYNILVLLFSCPVMSNSVWPHGLQPPRMSGLPVPHHLLEFAQVQVLWIGDAVQPSHPLMPSSPSALNLSQHQGPFQWVRCSHQMTKILELQLQHQSFQSCSPLRLTGLISLLFKRLSGVFSSTTVQRHQFFGILPSLWSRSHNRTWP